MGVGLSYNRHHAEDIDIKDGDIRRLWSYHSTSGGRYVQRTNTMVPGDPGSYLVAATGEDEGSLEPNLTEITFTQKRATPLTFGLNFKNREGISYSVTASEEMVKASAGSNSDTTFRVRELWGPNRPYVFLQSNKKNDDQQQLYLSSDGTGKMKLKVWNTKRAPPEASAQVDPAFLFRLVRPLNQQEEE